MKKITIILSLLASIAGSVQAGIITVASDNANNYGNQWSGNGGTGFDNWHFITDTANGFSGGFLANKASNNDLNHIASNPSNKAWGSYANGDGFNQFEAYRGFGANALLTAGDNFSVSLEHGAINQGGSTGFVLRNQNIHSNIDDYNKFSRFEFGFIGGGQHYSIFDGQGVIDTGISFTDSGLHLSFTLLSANLYQLDIFNATDNSLIQSRNGLLNGSGSIDSVSLYNRNTDLANSYFNHLTINKSIEVTEPSTWLLIGLTCTGLAFRRKA